MNFVLISNFFSVYAFFSLSSGDCQSTPTRSTLYTGLKQRLLTFLYNEAKRDGNVHHFLRFMPAYVEKLRMHRAQLFDGHYLLIRMLPREFRTVLLDFLGVFPGEWLFVVHLTVSSTGCFKFPAVLSFWHSFDHFTSLSSKKKVVQHCLFRCINSIWHFSYALLLIYYGLEELQNIGSVSRGNAFSNKSSFFFAVKCLGFPCIYSWIFL